MTEPNAAHGEPTDAAVAARRQAELEELLALIPSASASTDHPPLPGAASATDREAVGTAAPPALQLAPTWGGDPTAEAATRP